MLRLVTNSFSPFAPFARPILVTKMLAAPNRPIRWLDGYYPDFPNQMHLLTATRNDKPDKIRFLLPSQCGSLAISLRPWALIETYQQISTKGEQKEQNPIFNLYPYSPPFHSPHCAYREKRINPNWWNSSSIQMNDDYLTILVTASPLTWHSKTSSQSRIPFVYIQYMTNLKWVDGYFYLMPIVNL